MRSLRAFPLLFLGLCALLAAAMPSDPPGVQYQDVVVRRGQTVSHLAFEAYGRYDDSIAALVRADNPGIRDLDALQAGQVLRIRKSEAARTQQAPPDPRRTVQIASRKAIVTLVSGTGRVRRAGGSTEPLRANQALSKGDVVATGPDGYAELVIDNQSVLRLNRDTELRLVAIQEPAPASSTDRRPYFTRLALVRGRTWTHVQKWAGAIVNYQIQLPTAIAGVHGTVFETQANADSTGSVGVVEGEVGVGGGGTDSAAAPRRSLAPRAVSGPKEITAAQWMRLVRTGTILTIPKSGAPGEPVAWKPSDSAWTPLTALRD